MPPRDWAASRDVDVTLVDRTNHHLFQPLLYQVAMAGLSPADIAAPIRSMLSSYRNIRVLQGEVVSLDLEQKRVVTDFGELTFDYLILACGARHSYFGHDEWEEFAPGLKNLEQATEIRRRVLSAYEEAERSTSAEERKRFLTFVVVGGGPTGVELAGAIGEMSRFTLAKDFRNIDAKLARVILLEAGPRILPMFSEQQAARATRDLEHLGVQVWTNSAVTKIDADGRGNRRRADPRGDRPVGGGRDGIAAGPGGRAGRRSSGPRAGRARLEREGTQERLRGRRPGLFHASDRQAAARHRAGGHASRAATWRGRFATSWPASRDEPFHFVDKGQMATIGRSRAIVEMGRWKLAGFPAWLIVAGRAHLLSDRFQEPAAGRAAMGLVVLVVPSRGTLDRQQGVAIPSCGEGEIHTIHRRILRLARRARRLVTTENTEQTRAG